MNALTVPAPQSIPDAITAHFARLEAQRKPLPVRTADNAPSAEDLAASTKWWDGLSINEMKQHATAYLPYSDWWTVAGRAAFEIWEAEGCPALC